MPKTSRVKLPPSMESRERAFSLLAAAPHPLTAKELSQLLQAPYQISEKDLIPVLDGYVATQRLRSFAGATAKAKLRYWNRDVGKLVRKAGREAVQKSEQPATAKELASQLGLAFKVAEPDVATALDQLVADGQLFAIAPKTAKGKPRYWHQNAQTYARQLVRETLRAKGPQAEPALQKLVPGLTKEQWKELFEQAHSAKELWLHPPATAKGKALWAVHPPSPEPYLKELGQQLKKVVAQLAAADIPAADVRRAMVQLLEQAGISWGGGQPATAKPSVAESPSGQFPELDLLSAVRRLDPNAQFGALITFRDLRRAVPSEKAVFDRTVLDLSRHGRVSLHRHDYPASLSPEELDELVSDGQGTYYVGLALRQS